MVNMNQYKNDLNLKLSSDANVSNREFLEYAYNSIVKSLNVTKKILDFITKEKDIITDNNILTRVNNLYAVIDKDYKYYVDKTDAIKRDIDRFKEDDLYSGLTIAAVIRTISTEYNNIITPNVNEILELLDDYLSRSED